MIRIFIMYDINSLTLICKVNKLKAKTTKAKGKAKSKAKNNYFLFF
jgi:hypothetical protein